jgi:tryptophan 2,3-dioxygenase
MQQESRSETGGPARNARGVIAESYQDLQGLGVLAAARGSYPLPKASAESTLRAVFQAAEIALLNAADLLGRAAADLERRSVGPAVVKMFWVRGFHRLLGRLGMIPAQLGLACTGDARGVLRISESPAYHDYVAALRRFDQSVVRCVESGDLELASTLADRSLDSPAFNLFHLARLCNHEATIWERALAEVHVPAVVPSYEGFVAAPGIRAAVYDRVLSGDTYFTQFRGLHQVPETLSEEVNDRLEQAIRAIRSNRLPEAAEHLHCVDALLEGILASLPPIADTLATSDYHEIRENLGLTSGSHSVSLRYHLFTHLYEQLCEELACHAAGCQVKDRGEEVAEEAFRRAERERFHDHHAWMVHLLCDYCLKLRTFIAQWRDQHLHLPRNNLGSQLTKSLTGSPDAIRAVKQMRDAAAASDPMQPLVRARELGDRRSDPRGGPLTQYLDSQASLDSRILATTGSITQSRFQDVQERLGYFASRGSFVPPPRRRA